MRIDSAPVARDVSAEMAALRRVTSAASLAIAEVRVADTAVSAADARVISDETLEAREPSAAVAREVSEPRAEAKDPSAAERVPASAVMLA